MPDMHPVGCCTWIFAGEDLPLTVARAVRAALDGIELHGDLDGIEPVAAGRIIADAGLTLFSITPGDADISHPDPAIRHAALQYYERLIDWIGRLGHDGVRLAVHGQVGRIRPVASQAAENEYLVQSVQRIAELAETAGIPVVFELLNRYESHQVNTVEAGLALLQSAHARNLSLLPDAYHMNIEEPDPAAALRAGGAAIGLYHAADSNRAGVGEGHIDFPAQIAALDAIDYRGPLILEPTAPGLDPFRADKGDDFRDRLETTLAVSAARLRGIQEIRHAHHRARA